MEINLDQNRNLSYGRNEKVDRMFGKLNVH